MNNFPLKTLKLGWVAFHSVTFQLKCLDSQSKQYKKLAPVPSRFCNGLWIITRLRHFEFLSISADHLRLLPHADHQGNSVFCLQKVFYAKSCIKAIDDLNQNLNEQCLVTNCLKKARESYLNKKDARNSKSCSKD